MALSDIFIRIQAGFAQLRAALVAPPTTRVPLTNDEIKALRSAAINNEQLDRNTVNRVCCAALDARKRSRRYSRAMQDFILADG